MINLSNYLYNKVRPIIESWNEEGIYGLSFFVYTNVAWNNLPYFAISYNTEKSCNYSLPLSEERWTYAFWLQNEHEIISDEESTKIFLQWCEENNIKDVGFEDESKMYDEECRYIGKGPNGYYELLQVVVDIARRLHKEKVIMNTFKKDIPIIIHEYEYAWYSVEATRNGNPDGEASVFLEAVEKGFPE